MQALRYVGVCVGLAVLQTLVAVRVSYAQKHFSTALSEKNKGERDLKLIISPQNFAEAQTHEWLQASIVVG